MKKMNVKVKIKRIMIFRSCNPVKTIKYKNRGASILVVQVAPLLNPGEVNIAFVHGIPMKMGESEP